MLQCDNARMNYQEATTSGGFFIPPDLTAEPAIVEK